MEHVVALWLCLFLKLPLAAAHAPFKVITVTPALVRETLATKHEDADFLSQFGRLQFISQYPGLNIVDVNKPMSIPAARSFGRWFQEQSGARLILASSLDGLPSPIYSGLVLGANGRVIANFKILTGFRTPSTLVEVAEKTAAHIEQFSADRSHFARLAFENLRIAAGYDRDDEIDRIDLYTPEMAERYDDILGKIRKVVGLFEPGRPTWLLAESLADEGFSKAEAERLKALPGRVLTRVFVMDIDRIINIQKDNTKVHAWDCQNAFVSESR